MLQLLQDSTCRAIISQNVCDSQTYEEHAEIRLIYIAQVRIAKSLPQIPQNVTKRKPVVNVELPARSYIVLYSSNVNYGSLN